MHLDQQRSAAVAQKTNEAIQTRSAQGSAMASAADGGVSGYSVDALLNDFLGRQGRFNANVDTNFEYDKLATQGEMASTQARGQSQINSRAQPSLLGTGLAIANSGLSAAGGYMKNTAPAGASRRG